MSKTTIEKSTLPSTDNQIEISTVIQTKTTIVNNNTEYDKIDDNKEES